MFCSVGVFITKEFATAVNERSAPYEPLPDLWQYHCMYYYTPWVMQRLDLRRGRGNCLFTLLGEKRNVPLWRTTEATTTREDVFHENRLKYKEHLYNLAVHNSLESIDNGKLSVHMFI